MDGKENDKVLDKVRQYQNSIIKHSELGNDEKILSYISRLYEMPITVAHLQETGVGRTINSLRKYSGSVGHASRAIVSKWKNMVSKEEEENGCNQSDEEFSAHDSPTSSDEVKKMKTRERERESESEEKQSKRPESSDKSSRKSSKSKSEDSGSSSSHSKSHHHQHHHHQHHHHHHHRKEEKRDSHKSSHSRDKEKRREDRDRDGRKSKERSDDRKRRHEDEPSPGKKKRYESEEEEEELELELELEQEQEQEDRGRDEEVEQEVEEEDEEDEDEVVESENESSMQCDNTYNGNFLPEVEEYPDSSPQTQPDSTTLPEESFVEKKSSSKSTSKRHEKSRSSSKHRESEKEVNGAGHSSSKKDSNERKHSSSKEKEKPSSSSSSNKKEAKSFSSGKSDSEPSSKMKNKKKTATTTTKTKNLLIADGGIDSGSGASFAEALGMIEPTRTSATKQSFKKKTSHHSTSGSPIPIPIQIPTATPAPSTSTSSSSRTPKSSTLSPLNQSPNLLSPCTKLEPLDLNIGPQLPEITTNYKPLGHYNYNNDPSSASASASSSQRNNIGTKMLSEEEALCAVISSKTQRTKVFSGNKVNSGFVPTLFNLCVRVLQENIDALEYTGGVPYEILKPVLERATANQLLNAEYHNPYLVEDSDKLWELHCKRECRGLKRQEMESWRDMYLRCRDERDAKLKALTVNIKQSIDKSLPVRQTKLAYVDTMVKPPRGIARKQAKYGTDKKPIITPSSRLNSLAASGSGEKISVPNPGARSVSSSSSSSATMLKPKKAPLMQKTMAMLKSRFRR